MRLNKSAQSLVEYLAIFTLLAAGMIAGYQFITGGVGGGIKNLTATVDDAFHEGLTQAPPNPNVSIPGCSCGPTVKICGGTTAPGYTPSLTCPGNEKLYYQICNPAGCNNVPAYCTLDPTCCTDWELEPGTCGPNAPSPPAPPGGCPDGEGIGWRQCGNNPIERKCEKFPACNFSCENLPQNSVACPNTTTRLPFTMQYLLMNQCSEPRIPDDKCKAVCGPKYALNGIVCERCDDVVNNFAQVCHCRGNNTTIGTSNECFSHSSWSDVEVFCPANTVAESGHCVWRLESWEAGNQMRLNDPIMQAGVPIGWRCEGYRGGCGSCETCQQTLLHAKAFCTPQMSNCDRFVLVDLSTADTQGTYSTCEKLPLPSGYPGSKPYEETGLNGRAHYCALVDQFVPAATCNTSRISVMSDSLLIGWGSYSNTYLHAYPNRRIVNAQNDWCYNDPNCGNGLNYNLTASCRSNTYSNKEINKSLGCCPRSAIPGVYPDWQIEGWDELSGQGGYLHCLKPELPIHCPAVNGVCEAGTIKINVVQDAYMKHIPNLNCTQQNELWTCTWPPCIDRGPGYTMYAGVGLPDRMQHCVKKVDICVQQ